MLGFLAGLAWLPRSYQSQGSVTLLALRPVAGQSQGRTRSGPGMSPVRAARVIRKVISAPGTASSLAAQGYSEPYAVTVSTTGTVSPALTITVTGHDRTLVQDTLVAVLARMSADLARLQARVPGPGRLEAVPLSVTAQADLAIGQTARPYLIVGVLGLVLVLGVPVAVDGVAARRRRASEPVRGQADGLAPDMTGLARG